MERYNPFANPNEEDSPTRQNPSVLTRTSSSQLQRHQSAATAPLRADSTSSQSGPKQQQQQPSSAGILNQRQQAGLTSSVDTLSSSFLVDKQNARYSTSFPDPFGNIKSSTDESTAQNVSSNLDSPNLNSNSTTPNKPNNRSNSVTFANTATSHSIEDIQTTGKTNARVRLHERQATASAGLSSFLSRATSVTSSTVTDKVSGAVGSVRNAVDSLSSQIQSAVPSNLNYERLSSSVVGVGSSSSGPANVSISRQRVVLILDDINNTDWAQQFDNYRKLVSAPSSGGGSSITNAAQSTLTSFFSSATAQLSNVTAAATSSPLASSVVGGSQSMGLTSSSSTTNASYSNPSTNIVCADGLDLLIEQADFRDVSILANQISSTVSVSISTPSTTSQSSLSSSLINLSSSKKFYLQQQQSQQPVTKIVRPEYVVIRQNSRGEQTEHLRGIVTSLNYCLIQMFQPYDIWNCFQSRQLVFGKLLSVQKTLGREQFPLIPQIFCQTYQDLLNYINSPTLNFPCLLRTGLLGKGRIKIDNLQMLKDFSSIVATSNMSCTVEQYLDVKCDLIVQKIGTKLKLFRRLKETSSIRNNINSSNNQNVQSITGSQQLISERQPASRQTSLGSGVISSLISSSTSQQQALSRNNSCPISGKTYEKLSDVSARYKSWIEAISREFNDQLNVFSLKIVVATNDREYIVNLNDCSNNFLGSPENQDEDRRSFVELIISIMNSNIPNGNQSITTDSKETRNSLNQRTDSNEEQRRSNQTEVIDTTRVSNLQAFEDKKKYNSQIQINQKQQMINVNESSSGRSFSQMGNRSQSVSVNQSDYMNQDYSPGSYSSTSAMAGGPNPATRSYFSRRASDKSADCLTNSEIDYELSYVNSPQMTPTQSSASNSSPGLHQRQSSLGQSFFDQTSTAFSSFQKQSMSFFKRLEARGGNDLIVGNTPPQSAKSDKAFDKSFISSNATNFSTEDPPTRGLSQSNNKLCNNTNGFKSQSIDSSGASDPFVSNRGQFRQGAPAKPPPPVMSNRQSSLASYSSNRTYNSSTPNTTPNQTRQNSTVAGAETSANQSSGSARGKVVRQNSALSAFEPYDSEVAAKLKDGTENLHVGSDSLVSSNIEGSTHTETVHHKNLQLDPVKRSGQFDSASITSAESNSTGETATAEDTMNNLKKTFASIFGDKCE